MEEFLTLRSGYVDNCRLTVIQNCGGTGSVRQQQRTPFGVMSTTKQCSACGGRGKIIKTPCSKCRGSGFETKSETVEIKGTNYSHTFTLESSEDGDVNIYGASPADFQ